MASTPHERPAYLAVVHRFVNSLDLDPADWSDEIQNAGELTDWLRADCALPPGEHATEDDLRLALHLRTALRGLARANHGEPAEAGIEELARRCFARLPLQAVPGDVVLAPVGLSAVRAALAGIVAGYATAVAAGEWRRLRQCPGDECGWVFWDSSARANRRWCTMAVCGNRAKVRAFSRRNTT
ncbi:CGNR zinc finger domain-containing protein [Kribbella deserti]|uniref:CGNR zinc finger domain-containing protein n=1 Tax=Kribbella deserti TaxID=1926257 RepID=A0ABV6QUW6_9ACTN